MDNNQRTPCDANGNQHEWPNGWNVAAQPFLALFIFLGESVNKAKCIICGATPSITRDSKKQTSSTSNLTRHLKTPDEKGGHASLYEVPPRAACAAVRA